MEILNVVSSIKLSVSRLPQPVIITENVNTFFVLYPVLHVHAQIGHLKWPCLS